MAQMPDYSLIARRGQAIGSGIEKALNIIAQTGTNAVQEYKRKRTVENAYKGIRGSIVEGQEKFGLSDSQADAMASRLKYRDGEKMEAYEKRVAPTLKNMLVWQEYTKDPDFKIDLPNPFLDNQTFFSTLDMQTKRKEQKEIGEAVQSSVFGDRVGGLPEGTDISNIQEDIKTQDPSTFQGPEQGVTQAGTQEDATGMIAARMGNRPVSEKQLQQFPAFRSLPSEAGMAKSRQSDLQSQNLEAGIGLKGAQTEAAQALTKQRNTSEMLARLKASENKKQEVNNIKDLSTITRMEISARELLKDTPKYGVDAMGMPNESGDISEDWIDVKELSEILKEKRNQVAKAGGQNIPEPIKPTMEAISIANKVEEDYNKIYPKGAKDDSAMISLAIDRINQFAKFNGVSIDPGRIEAALKQGSTVADIAQRIIMAKKQTPTPQQEPTIGGRIGR